MQILDFNRINRKYVLIDDNHPPYQLATLDAPCVNYTEPDWQDCKLVNIIVPLYRKIYLDPIRARKNFLIFLKIKAVLDISRQSHVLRIFLVSSRTYKEYIAINEDLDDSLKQLILSLSMPKFIWVAEISDVQSFENKRVNGIMIQDATEPFVYNDEVAPQEMAIFCGFYDKFFSIFGTKVEIVKLSSQSFPHFSGNFE